MRRLMIILICALSACAPRGALVATDQPPAAQRQIFVGSSRGTDETGGLGSTRAERLYLARYDIGIPPERDIGDIQYPLLGRKADPKHDFTLAGKTEFSTDDDFHNALRPVLAAQNHDAVVFVHGYNMNFAEGLYRVAQLGHDFDLPGVLVHYSWPSKAHVMGYAYDRDSALFARDGLENLLDDLRQSGARRILIVAHSMGSALTMETLRQMRIGKNQATLERISGVVLISPDIDVDLFRAQAQRIAPLPEPFIIFTSQRDMALRLAARISGEPTRLGSLEDIEKIADLEVTVIETGAFAKGAGHFNVGDNPALIRLLQQLDPIAGVIEGEARTHPDLAASAVITLQSATKIVLRPLGG